MSAREQCEHRPKKWRWGEGGVQRAGMGASSRGRLIRMVCGGRAIGYTETGTAAESKGEDSRREWGAVVVCLDEEDIV